MNININNANLLSQSSLLSKLFSQGNGAFKQTGMTTVNCGVQHRNSSYYYNKDGVPFFQRIRQSVASMGRIGKRLCPYQIR